jgi:tetratricopeptide (TPR) repeat protein
MAQPVSNAKIEELQFRLKTDPKSRLFFQLAEELRKHGRLAEAEHVLRAGLTVHAAYLSAWVSLGRVLREQHKNAEAVEALTMAMQVDPGNVVAARLLADTYLDLGEKVEAIKKYKLVHALMPSDEELEAKIERLDREIQAPAPIALAEPPESVEPQPEPETAPESASPFSETHSEAPFQQTSEPASPSQALALESSAPDPYEDTLDTPFDTGDDEPMAAHHVESPFEEPSAYSAAALEVEQPAGMHVEEAPTVSVDPWSDEQPEGALNGEPAADVFAPAAPEAEPQSQPDEDDDVTATTTMADLYVRQGLIDEARRIYEHLLQRDPFDTDVRAKLEALGDQQQPALGIPSEPSTDEEPEPITGNPRVLVLQKWLDKVGRREEGRV